MFKFVFWKWVFGHSKKYILLIVLISAISGLIALSFILLVVLSKQVIDMVSGKHEGNILTYSIFFIGIVAFQAILNIINSNIRVRACSKIGMNIKRGVFSSLLKSQVMEINRFHSGEYINRLTSDIEIVSDGVVSIIPQAVSMSVKIFAGLGVLMSIDPLYTLVLITCSICIFLISWLYRKRFKDLHKSVQQTEGRTRSFMQECIENIVVIKSFISEIPVINRLGQLQEDNYKARLSRNTVSNLANTGVYMLFSSGYYFTLVWGAFGILHGKMSYGSLVALLQVFDQVKAPFKNISGIIPRYFSMAASSERLQEIENLKHEESLNDGVDIDDIYKKMTAIKFSNISFKYNEDKIFEAASTSIKKDELTVIVGTSGAGKSTFIRLLLGLIKVDEGQIYINTGDKDYEIDTGIRKLFSYVPQGNMILSGTIKENIAFFNDMVDEEEIINVSRIACVMDFASQFPRGLDTLIGEHGTGLSEGQVQRIAIARALISKAPILLLDEATSALDSVTEKRLLNNLKSLNSKTCIFVSHREATVNGCSRVIKIDNYKFQGGHLSG